LEEPDLTDGVHQLGHRFLVEDLPGLARIGHDGVQGQFREVGRGVRLLGDYRFGPTLEVPGIDVSCLGLRA
jgi:hypothetical protein